jgi:uncharacterized protein (TIGR00661 family)
VLKFEHDCFDFKDTVFALGLQTFGIMKPRILFAVLDWGLGHATRSLPLISAAQALGVEPVVASAGNAGAYLKKELPGLTHLELPAYDIRYRYGSMVANMGLQLPKIAHTAWREHRLLQQIIKTHDIKAVVSDNRFGCWSEKVPSVFVSHQLQLRTPHPWLDSFANAMNRYFLRRYDRCWVPDFPGAQSLSGELSVPPEGLAVEQLGWLSRFAPSPVKLEHSIDVLVLLSGPEPQRTYLEQALVSQLKTLPGRKVLVRGLAEAADELPIAGIEVHNYLAANELEKALRASVVVVCRSGYSSLMDLCTMGKKALLIPTPGQTEQLYLAQRLHEKGWVAVQQQGEIALAKGLLAAKRCAGLQPPAQSAKNMIEKAMYGLIALIN